MARNSHNSPLEPTLTPNRDAYPSLPPRQAQKIRTNPSRPIHCPAPPRKTERTHRGRFTARRRPENPNEPIAADSLPGAAQKTE